MQNKELEYQFKRNFEYVLAKRGHTETKDLYHEKIDKIYYCIILNFLHCELCLHGEGEVKLLCDSFSQYISILRYKFLILLLDC